MAKVVKKNKLRYWLVDYITNNVHKCKMDKKEKEAAAFNSWAKNFKREEADFLVGMEFWEWEQDPRTEIPLPEVVKYANEMFKIVLDKWNL